jgi:hypothetical protein
MIHLSVFTLSLSSIAFEILLARIFSIGQWNHLSFMVISMALFGFAVSGVVTQLWSMSPNFSLPRLSSDRAISLCSNLYCGSIVMALLTLNRLPLDYFRLTLETVQIGYLLLSYLSAAIPFFFAGFVISAAYASIPQQAGWVYFTSMSGSAVGAVVPALLLPFLDEGALVIFSGMIPLGTVFAVALKNLWNRLRGSRVSSPRTDALPAIAACLLGVAVFLLTPAAGSVVSIRTSPYKALRQTLQFPDARVAQTLTGLHGRIDHVNSRFIRSAPGLSLKFSGRLPDQSIVFKDGDTPVALYHIRSPADSAFAKFTLSYLGYALHPTDEKIDEKILIIQNDGGLGIPCAIASGRPDIQVVTQDPHVAALVCRQYHLPVANQNHRAFLSPSR